MQERTTLCLLTKARSNKLGDRVSDVHGEQQFKFFFSAPDSNIQSGKISSMESQNEDDVQVPGAMEFGGDRVY